MLAVRSSKMRPAPTPDPDCLCRLAALSAVPRIVGRSCAKGEGGDRDREESKPQLGPQAGASSQKKFSTAHADAVCRSWMAYLPYDLPILGECGLHRKNSDSEDKKSRGS